MNADTMTPMERVTTALGHREPDRVPLFLLNNLHGARESGLSPREYFSDPIRVARTQVALQKRHQHDCLYAFFYAAIEVEALGGEVCFVEEGPPNAGTPLLRDPEDIERLEGPNANTNPVLKRVLSAIAEMRRRVGETVPIIGVVMSPFSLPVMQLGFEAYLLTIFERPDSFWELVQRNREFCVHWANAQIDAGATAICYFDPVSSPTIMPAEHYAKIGGHIARTTLARIRGPVATHMASGITAPIAEAIADTGTVALGVGDADDLGALKACIGERVTLIGNLNGLRLVHQEAGEITRNVQRAVAAAGPGGGFILADNHGELPWQVTDEQLAVLREAVTIHGHYPLAGARTDHDG